MNLLDYDYGLLFVFKVCVDEKSFSKAAEVLHIKQPTISYSIKKLEGLLNIQLFHRSNLGISLTEEGKILYDYIASADNQILSGLSIISELQKKDLVELNVGIVTSVAYIYISEVIQKFQKLFPNVMINIFCRSDEEMLEDLKKKKLDLVIFSAYNHKNYPGIVVKKIVEKSIVCVGVEIYKKYFDSKKDQSSLNRLTVILPNSETNMSHILATRSNISNLEIYHTIYCNSAIAAKEIIMSGIGVGYINRDVVQKEIQEEKLFVFDEIKGVNDYCIYYAHQEKNVNGIILKFLDILKKVVISRQ